jgi:anti-anti-sigma factor
MPEVKPTGKVDREAFFSVARRETGSAMVVMVFGRVDPESARDLREAIEDAGRAAGGRLVLDLTGCFDMDEPCLPVVLETIRRLRTESCECRVADAVQGPCRRLLERARKHYGLRLYPDAQTALADL